MPDVEVTSRAERIEHKVELEIRVTGFPVYSGSELCTKKPITPEIANVTYRRRACSGPWTSFVTVYGSQPSSLLRGWANFYPHLRDRWPEWLLELVDEHQPDEQSMDVSRG